MFLSLIFKFQVVDINNIAVFDAHLFKTLEEAALVKLGIEVVPGFVVIEIDVLNKTLQPGAGDQPGAAQMLDEQFVGITCLGCLLYELRLVNGHRGQGAQLLGNSQYQLTSALGRTGADFIEGAAQCFYMLTQTLQVIRIGG